MGTRIAKIKVVKESNAVYDVPKSICSTRDSANVFTDVMRIQDEAQEVFVACYLDTRNRIMGIQEISRGTLTASLVSPREVFKGAVLSNAAKVIVAHNHPSGSPEPSPEDLKITERLVKAGRILDIMVLDHIIVGTKDDWVSLMELHTLLFK